MADKWIGSTHKWIFGLSGLTAAWRTQVWALLRKMRTTCLAAGYPQPSPLLLLAECPSPPHTRTHTHTLQLEGDAVLKNFSLYNYPAMTKTQGNFKLTVRVFLYACARMVSPF